MNCLSVSHLRKSNLLGDRGSFGTIAVTAFDLFSFNLVLFSDIDECRISFGICENGECINTPGGFRCECDPGFIPVMMDQMCMGK